MENNFDLLKGFTRLRDFAICMSKNNICCHHKTYYDYECGKNDTGDACRRCWLDFLTSDEGLDLSYLDKAEESESVEESKEVKCWKCGKVLTEENISKKMYTSFPPKYSCKDCD